MTTKPIAAVTACFVTRAYWLWFSPISVVLVAE